MSRTYRQLSGDPHWKKYEVDYELKWFPNCMCNWVKRDKTSKEYKKALAKFHSDAGVIRFKEPGPMWFIREFTQVPYRMKCKTELAKWRKDNEYEVIIEEMPHLDYWT